MPNNRKPATVIFENEVQNKHKKGDSSEGAKSSFLKDSPARKTAANFNK